MAIQGIRKKRKRNVLKYGVNRSARIERELLLFFKYGVKKDKIKKIWSPKQLRIKKIIHLAGGHHQVAKDLGFRGTSSISHWVKYECIPPTRWAYFSKKLGISIGALANILMKEEQEGK